MRKIYFLLSVLIVFRSALFSQAPVSSDSIAQYLSEIKNITGLNTPIWGYDIWSPIILVDPQTREVIATEPDTAGLLKSTGQLYQGVLPAKVNIANTAVTWGGKQWAMILLPLPVDKFDRVNLITHELFHRAQPHLGFIANNPDNQQLDKKNGRVYLRLELAALSKALAAKTGAEAKSHLKNAFAFRAYRRLLFPGADSTENLMELNEGLAEYTGMMMSGRNEMQTREHFIKSIDNFMRVKSFVRSFAYETIPVYGRLLHEQNVQWNKDINKSTDLTAYFTKQFSIVLSPDLKGFTESTSALYDGGKIIAEETERELSMLRQITEYKRLFITEPHLTIPLRKMNVSFDYRLMVSLEDIGTVYPIIRVSDAWGILNVTKGALLSAAWDQITVTSPVDADGKKLHGDGWTLELNDGYTVTQAPDKKNFILEEK
jgi:hypothetical protein